MRGAYLGATRRLRSTGGLLCTVLSSQGHTRLSAHIMRTPCLCRAQHLQAMQASVQLQYQNSPWSGALSSRTQEAKTLAALDPTHAMPFMACHFACACTSRLPQWH